MPQRLYQAKKANANRFIVPLESVKENKDESINLFLNFKKIPPDAFLSVYIIAPYLK